MDYDHTESDYCSFMSMRAKGGKVVASFSASPMAPEKLLLAGIEDKASAHIPDSENGEPRFFDIPAERLHFRVRELDAMGVNSDASHNAWIAYESIEALIKDGALTANVDFPPVIDADEDDYTPELSL